MPEQFTDLEKLRCVERELKLRENVYPRRVRDRFMKAKEADRELRLMEAIVADYKAKVQHG